MEKLFANSARMVRKQATVRLQELTECKQAAAYQALSASGRFAAHLKEDDSGWLEWLP
jgi:hypothetical protein